MENKKNGQDIVEIFISKKDRTGALVLNDGCLGFWVVFLWFCFLPLCVCVCTCVQVHKCVPVHVCVHMCGGQRTTLGIILQ